MIKRLLNNVIFGTEGESRFTLFRWGMGGIVIAYVFEYLFYDLIHDRFLIDNLQLNYPLFSFLPTININYWIYYLFGLLLIGGICMCIKRFYFIGVTLSFLIFSYLLFHNQFYYHDDLYLIWGLVSVLLISLGSVFSGEDDRKIPKWIIYMLRTQHLIALFFVSFSKFHTDWWSGKALKVIVENIQIWNELIRLFDVPVYFFRVMAILVVVIQLLIPLFLLIRKTRKMAFLLTLIQTLIYILIFTLFVKKQWIYGHF